MEREKSKGIRFRPWAVAISIRGPSPHKTRLRMTLSRSEDFSRMSTEPNRLQAFSENKARDMRPRRIHFLTTALIFLILPALWAFSDLGPAVLRMLWLPTSKQLLEPVPGEPQKLNSFPVTLAMSPDRHFLAALNAGYGTAESNFQQSIAILNLASNQVADFPDTRLGQHAHQSYFEGLAFSKDGSKFYASLGSITDPEGKKSGNTGNGIAVYSFAEGKITPLKVIPIPVRAFTGHKKPPAKDPEHPDAGAPAYPSGIAVVASQGKELLLVADNLSDDAALVDAESGDVVHRFDLSG